MRPSLCRSCLASLSKLLNFLQTLVGVSIVLYSAWILNHLRKGKLGEGVGFDLDKLSAPRLVCALMGIGIPVCLIVFTGHVAAKAISSCCLCFKCVLVGDIVSNKHWPEELPYDSTGEVKRLRAFIEDNIDICERVAVIIIVIQYSDTVDCIIEVGKLTLYHIKLLLAMILRAMVPRKRLDYDTDEDFVMIRMPLLNTQSGSSFTSTTIDVKGHHSDIWSSQIRQKYGLNQN